LVSPFLCIPALKEECFMNYRHHPCDASITEVPSGAKPIRKRASGSKTVLPVWKISSFGEDLSVFVLVSLRRSDLVRPFAILVSFFPPTGLAIHSRDNIVNGGCTCNDEVTPFSDIVHDDARQSWFELFVRFLKPPSCKFLVRNVVAAWPRLLYRGGFPTPCKRSLKQLCCPNTQRDIPQIFLLFGNFSWILFLTIFSTGQGLCAGRQAPVCQPKSSFILILRFELTLFLASSSRFSSPSLTRKS